MPFDAVTLCAPLTEKHRGFAFVQFDERGDAADAIDNMNGAELFGRVLKVNLAKPDAASRGSHRPGLAPTAPTPRPGPLPAPRSRSPFALSCCRHVAAVWETQADDFHNRIGEGTEP